MRRYLSLTVCSCGLLLGAFAQDPSGIFERGNVHYRAGRFSAAAAAYDSIIASGSASLEVYYNLGNARYRTGKMAKAILAYERAHRLDPSDDDVAYNLKLANLRIVDRIDPVPELFFVNWLRHLASLVSLSVTTAVLLFSWAAFFGALAFTIALKDPSRIPLFRWIALGALIVLFAAGSIFTLQLIQMNNSDDAVVVAAVVTAKNSPDPQSLDAFVIHEGLKVRLSDFVGEWVKITLADGKVGWIRQAECERV